MPSTAGGTASSRLPEMDRKRREVASGRRASQSEGSSPAERCHALCKYSTLRRVRAEICRKACARQEGWHSGHISCLQ